MKMNYSKFKNCSTFVAELQKRSKKYPLINRFYIPIIKAHANKYPGFTDFEDWLCILYFQHLWLSVKEQLIKTERTLETIYQELSSEAFDHLSRDLLEYCMHPTVDGVHNKLLDFYGELQGMIDFIEKGYKIKRIPRSDKPTADFYAEQGENSITVECKFIHVPDPIKRFINRYTRYLFAKDSTLQRFGGDKFSYATYPKDLTEENIKKLKKFVSLCISNNNIQSNKTTISCDCQVEIVHTYDDKIAPNLIPIEDQVSFFGTELEKFLTEYVKKRAKQATRQVKSSAIKDQKESIYIFIELAPGYNMPFEEMDHEKSRILGEFNKKHGLDIDIILKFFPPIDEPFCPKGPYRLY